MEHVSNQFGGIDPTMNQDFGFSLPEQIVAVLSEEIVERKLPARSKLREADLAERFGTSRAPIREAIYLLEQQGLVERMPRRGAMIREFSRKEVEELYRIRSVLEGFALEHICEDGGMVDVCFAALEPIIRDMEKAKNEAKLYHELNFRFHKTIILLSRSDLLRRLYTQIEGPLKIFLRRSFLAAGAVPKSFGEHMQILDAIKEADTDKARRILERHDDDGMKRALAASPPE